MYKLFMTPGKNHPREDTDRIQRLDRKLSDLGLKINKDEDSRKVTGEVFDEVTLLALYKLVTKKSSHHWAALFPPVRRQTSLSPEKPMKKPAKLPMQQ
jgi:Serine/threonine protein kinase involved in cell cycle control